MSFIEIHDQAFGAFVMANAPVERLPTDFDWVEGPVGLRCQGRKAADERTFLRRSCCGCRRSASRPPSGR